VFFGRKVMGVVFSSNNQAGMKWNIILGFILHPFLCYCQYHTPKCADLRECIVYSRSQDTHQPYKIFISGSAMKQVNLATGDSSVWEIHWAEECGFTIKYLSGNDSLSQGQKYYLQYHVIALKIERITPDYYLYTAYRDRIGHRLYARDTLWIQQTK
jgi:hypothetical protein